MPKPTKGKRLGGSASHEDQIISNLISALIEHEKIETTVTKAKTVKPYAEKVITKEEAEKILKDAHKHDHSHGEEKKETKKKSSTSSMKEKKPAKYNGKSQEITPARINKICMIEVHATVKKLYHQLGLKGVCRSEFIIVNSIPHLLVFFIYLQFHL